MATHQPATAVPTPPTMLQDKLLEHDKSELEEGRDGIPQDIWDDIQKNEQFIYYSLMFLNGSVMWAYYSCLSAQDFYAAKFEGSGVDFRFLTTMILSWPMVVGHFIQMLFALDKKYDQKRRVTLGFLMFMAMALCIMAVSTVNWDTKKSKATGAWLILACFAVIGASNVLAEATFYMLAALFPFDKFTHGVQIGNVSAGIINITVSTIKASEVVSFDCCRCASLQRNTLLKKNAGSGETLFRQKWFQACSVYANSPMKTGSSSAEEHRLWSKRLALKQCAGRFEHTFVSDLMISRDVSIH